MIRDDDEWRENYMTIEMKMDENMNRESWMVFQLAKSVASSVAELRARENGIRI